MAEAALILNILSFVMKRYSVPGGDKLTLTGIEDKVVYWKPSAIYRTVYEPVALYDVAEVLKMPYDTLT